MTNGKASEFLPGFDNRRRGFIIAAFLAVFTLLAVLRVAPWQPVVILALWLGAIVGAGELMRRYVGPQHTVRLATAAFCLDSLFLSAGVFYIGGALGFAMAFYLFLVMVAASMLPLRNAFLVAAVASASFALLAVGEVSGELTRPGFMGLPLNVGAYRLGFVVVMLGAVTMAVAVYAQQTLTGAIREAEHSQRVLLEVASDMIVTLDHSGQVLSVNGAVVEQTGYNRVDLVGTDIISLVAPAVRGAFEHQLALVRLGSRAPFEVTYTHVSGGQRWMSGTLTPVPESGARGKMLLIARDITQAKAAERERERLRNELAQALRMQALGRLVSGVAHELNNPLTTILATADDLLESVALKPDDHESLAIVRQQAQRARGIVRDMAAFVRTGSERKHERILPSVALSETVAAIRPDVEALGASLQAEIPANMEPIEIDRAGFDQVITNIVMNAAQAATRGGIVVVRANTVEGFSQVVVEDNGPGIASDVLAHIFEPFYTTKRTGQGTGLGLSLSLGIVQHYGGSLIAENRVFSREGSSGARFTIRIPNATDGRVGAIAEHAGTEALPAAADEAISRVSPPAGRAILVIDDEPTIRRTMRRHLERFGWVVEDLASAVEALPRVLAAGADARYAAIICDIKMPVMTGLEFCARLETQAPHMLGRLILVSGDMSLNQHEVRKCKAAAALAKPFDIQRLRTVVDRVVTGVVQADVGVSGSTSSAS